MNLKVAELQPFYDAIKEVKFTEEGITVQYGGERFERDNSKLVELLGM